MKTLGHISRDDYDPDVASSPRRTVVPSWTFLTNHAHVLVAISRDPELRQRDIADLVGITQGAVTRILGELETSGCITHERIGRRNRYHINQEAGLRHPLEAGVTIGELVSMATADRAAAN